MMGDHPRPSDPKQRPSQGEADVVMEGHLTPTQTLEHLATAGPPHDPERKGLIGVRTVLLCRRLGDHPDLMTEGDELMGQDPGDRFQSPYTGIKHIGGEKDPHLSCCKINYLLLPWSILSRSDPAQQSQQVDLTTCRMYHG